MQQFGKLLVGLIAAAFGYVVVQNLTGNSNAGAQVPSRAEMTELLLDAPTGATLRTLHDRVPEEFEKIVTRSIELIETGQSDLAFVEAQKIAIEIRRSRADNLWRAPSASISAVLTKNADFYESISGNPETCARVVVMGPAALDPDFAMQNLAAISDSAIAMFNAVFDGTEASGTPISSPTDSQIEAVLGAWTMTLTDEGLVDGLANAHPTNTKTCAAVINFYRHLAAQGDELTDQVRRQLVVDMAKS